MRDLVAPRGPADDGPGRGEAFSRAGGRGQRDPLRRGGAGQRLAPAAVRPAHRALRPRPRSGAARARLVRLGVRGDRVRRARGPLPRGVRDRRARPTPGRAPSWRGRSSCAACGRTRPTSRSTATGWARRSPSSRPAARPGDDEIEVVVPLRGLRMPVVRLELATATIVRADTVEVPAEARAAEGAGAAGWEPTFLAAARVSAGEAGEQDGQSPDAGARSVEAFRQLITALRLFQAGGVGLGPYAWTRAGRGSLAADRDRRRAAEARRLPARRGLARRADHALARARLPLDRFGRGRDGPAHGRRGGAGDLPLRGGPGAKRRPGGAERLPAGASVRARGRRSGRPGPGDAGRRPLRRARAALRDQGNRGPRARSRARAVERRAGSRGGGCSDGGRDRGRDRGADARHPQGRRLRPPGRRPSRDRRRDPAGRRARRGRGRGRAAGGLRGMGPADRGA